MKKLMRLLNLISCKVMEPTKIVLGNMAKNCGILANFGLIQNCLFVDGAEILLHAVMGLGRESSPETTRVLVQANQISRILVEHHFLSLKNLVYMHNCVQSMHF